MEEGFSHFLHFYLGYNWGRDTIAFFCYWENASEVWESWVTMKEPLLRPGYLRRRYFIQAPLTKKIARYKEGCEKCWWTCGEGRGGSGGGG